MMPMFAGQAKSLASLLEPAGVTVSADVEVTGIALDSRAITAGDVFVALRGELFDGRNFIADAIALGAVAILVDASSPYTQTVQVPVVAVVDLPAKLSLIAGIFYGNPSEKLNLIGVTGTNGKSTCVHLLAQMAHDLGRKAASIGTLGVVCGGETLNDSAMTTPDAIACQKALADLRANDVSTVAMEVSSHGLALHRVAALNFRAAVFTNLSHDHLDFHGTLEAYAQAKGRLFQWPKLQFAIINLDDDFAPLIRAQVAPTAKALTYSLRDSAADVFVSDIHYGELYTRFQLRSPWGEAKVISGLMGDFNVYNLTAVITTLCAQGASFHHVIELCERVRPVPGRMQRLSVAGGTLRVIVDYAHTPDALEKALLAVKSHTEGKLWCIFGCGGDRDRSKRQPMARVAETLADQVIVTSDNPRTEDPQAIIDEICAGFSNATPMVRLNRAEAIEFAVANAANDDVILLAGKGHENYQIIGTHKVHFSDIECAENALQARGQPDVSA